jgi:hypothetical protein
MSAYADQINETGFMIHVDSVGETTVWTTTCNWFAAPLYRAQNTTQYQVGHYSTLDDHYRNHQQMETSRRIDFPYPFDIIPTVLTWIDGFEFSTGQNWRIKSYVTNVDLTGFTVHVDTWYDTVLYSGNVSWIAFPSILPNAVSGVMTPPNVHAFNISPSFVSGDVVHVDFPPKIQTGSLPEVLDAFASFDLDNGWGPRFDVRGNVSSTEMDFVIGSFYNSTFYWGEVPYIAVFA